MVLYLRSIRSLARDRLVLGYRGDLRNAENVADCW